MEELIEEILNKHAGNVSANHWIRAIHEDNFKELTEDLLKLCTRKM